MCIRGASGSLRQAQRKLTHHLAGKNKDWFITGQTGTVLMKILFTQNDLTMFK